jgi:hypothetical protein
MNHMFTLIYEYFSLGWFTTLIYWVPSQQTSIVLVQSKME